MKKGTGKFAGPGSLSLAQLSEAELAELRKKAAKASALLKVLANPDRLCLMAELAEGEKNVGELEEASGIVQPTLSQQLGFLREAGLVETRRDGKKIYYCIASTQALAVMKVLYDQFCGPRKPRA